MFKRLLIVLMIAAAVMASASQLSSAQDNPLRPRRDLDTGQLPIERAPDQANRGGSTHPSIQAAPLQVTGMADWSKLTYQSYTGGWDIFTANGDGTHAVRLTSAGTPDITPRLNRGATRIVFASSEPGNYEILAMDRDGRNRVRLTNQAANDYNPAWSPDGSKILFNSYRDGQSEIYMMNANGTNVVRLTYDPAYDGQPVWSPDSSQIAFLSDRSGSGQIWVMAADGHGPSQLTSLAYAESPAWSPDGARIAFDADADGDGWQELMLMNANGSNAHVIGDTGTTADMWARGWSPDGRMVTFTNIYFIYYYGNWYWTAAYLYAADTVAGGAYALGGSDVDWYPDWQTTDLWPPTSGMAALPAVSASPIVVNWSGADVGPAGISGYDVQVKDGAGAWTMWLTRTLATSANYPGLGGHTYSFRVRAVDNSSNVQAWPVNAQASTSVDGLPPISSINALPAYYRGELPVSWSGSDPGGSGIKSYDVQYRDGITGTWTSWLNSTVQTTASFNGTAGHAYSFQVRATDRAQNVGAWATPVDNQSTAFYTWLINGRVFDLRHKPIVDASVSISPTSLNVITTSLSGYLGYLVDNTTREMTVTHAGYGVARSKTFAVASDIVTDYYLPPIDNLIANGDFETMPVADSWQTHGDLIRPVPMGEAYTGNGALWLGDTPRLTPRQDVFSALRWTYASAIDHTTLHVVGVVDELPGPRVVYTSKPITAVWSMTPTTILTAPVSTGTPRALSIVPDDQGGVHLAGIWYDSATSWYQVFYCHKLAQADACTTPTQLTQFAPYTWIQTGPKMARDQQGGVYLAWAAGGVVQYSYLPITGTWTPPLTVPQSSGEQLDVAVSPANGLYVAWAAGNGIFFSSRRSDGSWTPPETVGSYLYTQDLDVEVGQDSTVHLLGCEMGNRAWYTQKRPGTAWAPLQLLPGVVPAYGLDPSNSISLRLDTQDRPQAVYATDTAIRYSVRGVDGEWRQSVAIDAPLTTWLVAHLDENNLMHILWGESLLHYAHIAETTEFESAISQVVTLPPDLNQATLSIVYRRNDFLENGGQLKVHIDDGTNVNVIAAFTPDEAAWTHRWLNTGLWAGQTITLTTIWQQRAGGANSSIYLDDIALGSWLTPDPQAITPSHIKVPATQVITITGDNFFATPQVRVNETPLSDVTWINTTTLTATVPALPFGRYDLIVTNPGGQASGLPRALLVGYEVMLPIVRK